MTGENLYKPRLNQHCGQGPERQKLFDDQAYSSPNTTLLKSTEPTVQFVSKIEKDQVHLFEESNEKSELNSGTLFGKRPVELENDSVIEIIEEANDCKSKRADYLLTFLGDFEKNFLCWNVICTL